MDRWEYFFVAVPRNLKHADLVERFEELGNRGWELCCHDWGYHIFKRKVETNIQEVI